MRKFKFIYILLGALVGFTGCKDYLNVVPDNMPVIEHAFETRARAKQMLFTCYSYRPKVGDMENDEGLTNSDEFFQNYKFWPSFIGTRILKEGQSSVEPMANYWDGNTSLWVGIRDCNIFLDNVSNTPDLEPWEEQLWIAEVKFLKAFYHWQLAKRYGAIPIVDVNLPTNSSPEQVRVYREPFDDVVNYIVTLMDEAAEDLPLVSDLLTTEEGGRVNKQTAKTAKAEVLLFAASPLFNGNPDYASIVDNRGTNLFSTSYDENKWKLAADACLEAINMCHEDGMSLFDVLDPLVALANDTFQLQTTYREAICAPYNQELIWGSTNARIDNGNGHGTAGYASTRLIRLTPGNLNHIRNGLAPTIKSAELNYSSNGVPIDEDVDWNTNGWYNDRYKVREEPAKDFEKYYVEEGEKTAILHFNREPRFYASIAFDRGVYYGNGWYKFDDEDRNVKYVQGLNFETSGYQAGSYHSVTGYGAKKLHSFKDVQTQSTVTYNWYSFPIYRLGDLYLMYAEALNEFQGPNAETLQYIDRVRERAGLKGVVESWRDHSLNPDKPSTKEGLREIIQAERSAELLFESKRSWDVRRWKRISEISTPMGWNIYGETREEYYNVVPVSRKLIQLTTKDYLWPIKDYNLSINGNLVQNYGW